MPLWKHCVSLLSWRKLLVQLLYGRSRSLSLYIYIYKLIIICRFISNLLIFIFSDVKNNDIVPWVLSSVLSKYIPSPNPHVRQAACIWLLSIVKKLSHHKEIQVNACTNAPQSHLHTKKYWHDKVCVLSLSVIVSSEGDTDSLYFCLVWSRWWVTHCSFMILLF